MATSTHAALPEDSLAAVSDDGVRCGPSSAVFAEAQRSLTGALSALGGLAVSAEEFQRLYAPLQAVSSLLLDCSATLLRSSWLPPMLSALSALSARAHVPRLLVCDLLVAASLAPLAYVEHAANHHCAYPLRAWVRCSYTRVITAHGLRAALSALLVVHVDESPYFDGALDDLAGYDKRRASFSLAATLLHLNLLALAPPLRRRVRDSTLFGALCKWSECSCALSWLHPRWRTSVAQAYLNSCEVAAQLWALQAHHASAASLPIILELLTSDLSARVHLADAHAPAYAATWPRTVPTARAHLESELALARAALLHVQERVMSPSLSSSASPSSLPSCTCTVPDASVAASVASAVCDAVQRLSGVLRPSSPRYLTRVLLASRWHTSALLMTAAATALHVLPAQPSMFARLLAASHLGHSEALHAHNVQWFLSQHYARSLVRRVQSASRELRTAALEELWALLLDMGGTQFITDELVWGFWRVGHVSFLQALALPSAWFSDASSRGVQRFFLVSDPETQLQRLLSFDDLAQLIANKELHFAFEDDTFGNTVPHR